MRELRVPYAAFATISSSVSVFYVETGGSYVLVGAAGGILFVSEAVGDDATSFEADLKTASFSASSAEEAMARAFSTNSSKRDNAFATLMNAQPSLTTDEIRLDDLAGGDLYIGRAPDATLTSAASWEIVRIYRTATGATTRIRYRANVAWDDRVTGWT